MTERAYLVEVASRQSFRRSVFTRPRPTGDIDRLDRNKARSFNALSSGALIKLIGQEGIPVRFAVKAVDQIRSCPRNCRR
jgi:hypothetical protein